MNAALDGLTYTPNTNSHDTINVRVDDSATLAAAYAGEATGSSPIVVLVPSVTAPSVPIAVLNRALTFTSAGNAVTVADSGPSGTPLTVHLTATYGDLTLSTHANLSVSGDGSDNVTLIGTATAVNAALNGMTYVTSVNNYDQVQITVDDPQTIATGHNQAIGSIFVIVMRPNVTVPAAQAAAVGGTLTFASAGGNAITAGETSISQPPITVTLADSHGALALAPASVANLTSVSYGAGNRSVTFTGSLAAVNAALNGLTYVTTVNSDDVLTVAVNDLATQAAGQYQATGSVAIGLITFPALGTISNTEGDTIARSLAATSPDSLTYQATGLPPGLTMTSAGLVAGTLSYSSAANDTVVATATDAALGVSATLTFTWHVAAAPPAVINGFVFQDANGNGVQDGGDGPLAGVTATLTNAAGQTVGSTATDSSGNYSFSVYPPGQTYTVTFTAPADYPFSTAASASISTARGQTYTFNAGLTPLAHLTIVATQPLVEEGNSDPDAFTITRTGNLDVPLTVACTVDTSGANAATPGTDYPALSGSVSLPAGVAAATVAVNPYFDNVIEGTQYVVVDLSAGAFQALDTPSTATVAIIDRTPLVSIAALDPVAIESPNQPATIRITRNGPVDFPETVNYSIGGTATTSEYVALSGSALFQVGQPYADVTIYPLSVTLPQSSETIVLTLLAGSDYAVDGTADTAAARLYNAPVTVTPVANTLNSATQGRLYTATVASFTTSDANAAPALLTATINWGEGTTTTGVITPNGSGGFAVSGSYRYQGAGSFQVQITVQDEASAPVTVATPITVTANPLTLTGIDVAGTENTSFTLAVATFSAAAGSGGFIASIDWGDGSTAQGVLSSSNGVYSISGSHAYAAPGTYPVQVVVTDNSGDQATVIPLATIADAPLTLAAVNSFSLALGANFSGTLAHLQDADTAAVAGDYFAQIDWGDGTVSAGTVVADPSSGFDVQGQHAYHAFGAHTIAVTVAENAPGTASAAASTTVTIGAGTTGLSVALNVGDSTVIPLARIADANPDPTSNGFTVAIDWGDGQTSVGTVLLGADNVYRVYGSHAYGAAGTYTVTITITAADGSSTTVTDTAQVTTSGAVLDPALSVTGVAIAAVAGSAFSGVVAHIVYANPSARTADFTALIDWGDGSQPTQGTIQTNSQGGFDIAGSHTYTAQGSYTLAINLVDAHDSIAAGSATATVVDGAITAAGVSNVPATRGQEFDGTVATFSAASAASSSDDFTASIAWGDGQTSAGTINLNASGGFAVEGTHTYEATGTESITVTITAVAPGTATGVADSTAAVAPAPIVAQGLNFTAGVNITFSALVATFTNNDPAALTTDFSASVAWGDGSSSSTGVTIVANGPNGFGVQASHAYAAAGNFTVTVTITGPDGTSATAHGVVTASTAFVANGLTAYGETTLAPVQNMTFTGQVAHVTDGNPLDTAADLTALIDWGDGNQSMGTVVLSGVSPGPVFDIIGTNVYQLPGNYTVTVQIVDQAGNSATATTPASVTRADGDRRRREPGRDREHPLCGRRRLVHQ